jgi:molybdopterin/thiamine biosynthesis adenylyltransferase
VRDERIPELRGLDECRFVVVGGGTLGGPLAVELAKAGAGEVHVVDFDHYDLNNAVRHILRAHDAGLEKASAVAAQAERMSPFTRAVGWDFAVGIGTDASEVTRKLVERADVVIDVTASHSITRLLHRRASEAGKPLVAATLTAGGYGGRVLVLGGASPCLDCFLLAQDGGAVPRPQEGPTSNVTPFGCSHPAASCAGFDALEVVAVASRIAVQASGKTAYPPLELDWVVVNLRSAERRWEQGTLRGIPSASGADDACVARPGSAGDDPGGGEE